MIMTVFLVMFLTPAMVKLYLPCECSFIKLLMFFTLMLCQTSCYQLTTDVEAFLCFQYPLQMDLVLNLSQDGVRLIFDPVSQRLKVCSVVHSGCVMQLYIQIASIYLYSFCFFVKIDVVHLFHF